MMHGFVLAAGLVLGSISVAHAECVALYSTKFGDRSHGSISGVTAGKPCTISISLRTPGPRVSGTTLEDIEIIRQPHTGSVRKSGSSIIYTPSAGFAGKDSFFVKFRFATAQGEPRVASVRFAVQN